MNLVTAEAAGMVGTAAGMLVLVKGYAHRDMAIADSAQQQQEQQQQQQQAGMPWDAMPCRV